MMSFILVEQTVNLLQPRTLPAGLLGDLFQG